jgi:copper resistance protein C
MRFFRMGVGVLCSAFLLGIICGRADAHGYLAASFPQSKAHLRTSPHKIKLHFSLRADAQYSTIALEDDDGAVLASKTQQTASRDMDMSAPVLSPGRYHVRYRILSSDGDVVQGKIDFIVDE